MSEKSHVSMEQKMCIVCGKLYDSGAILLDKRMRQSMGGPATVTGYGMCSEHQALWDGGFVALAVIDPEKSSKTSGKTLKTEDAHRTGEIIHLKKEAYQHIFNAEPTHPMVFIDIEAAEKIKSMYAAATGATKEE